MKFDPHIHSIYSGDARSKPKDIIKQSMKVGLDAIAISDHNSFKGSVEARELSKNIDDFLVIPSIELSSKEGHILAIGVENLIPKNLSSEETLERIHDEGGIAIIPHPFSPYRHGLFFKNRKIIKRLFGPDSRKYEKNSSMGGIEGTMGHKLIEGVEVLNARYILGFSNFKANRLAKKYNLAKIGASDSHFLESIGDCYTEISDDYIGSEASVDDVIEAIRSKKTMAKGSRTSNRLIAKEVFNKKIRRIYL